VIAAGRPESEGHPGESPDPAAEVREALRLELTSNGWPVASDTVSLRRELYVWGTGDRAAAIFEFKRSAREAAETMYQGRWTSDLPPRFAVLPAGESNTPEASFLEQAGLSTLFFRVEGGDILFVELEVALDKIGRPAGEAGGRA
jgi:hypothetical protein